MHKPSLSQLVYKHLYPKPRPCDPNNFAGHISRHLVPEVRLETATFYGTLDCIEAQYPGLDYTHAPHRMRLGRFKHHERLFRAFDELGLTKAEILSLCHWEGTKWARERYQREEGMVVRDTTAADVTPASPRRPATVYVHPRQEPRSLNEQCRSVEEPMNKDDVDAGSYAELLYRGGEGDISDDDLESYGMSLNQRLLEAAAARERGVNVSLDAEWEQWLKEAVEHGRYADMISAIRAGQPLEMAFGEMPLPATPPSETTATGTSGENAFGIAAGRRLSRPGANLPPVRPGLYELLLTPRPTMDSTSQAPNAGAAR